MVVEENLCSTELERSKRREEVVKCPCHAMPTMHVLNGMLCQLLCLKAEGKLQEVMSPCKSSSSKKAWWKRREPVSLITVHHCPGM